MTFMAFIDFTALITLLFFVFPIVFITCLAVEDDDLFPLVLLTPPLHPNFFLPKAFMTFLGLLGLTFMDNTGDFFPKGGDLNGLMESTSESKKAALLRRNRVGLGGVR